MDVKKQLVSSDMIAKKSYGYGNKKESITIHQTGNRSVGVDAQAHANLQRRNNSRSASWHWTVDDKVAIQSFPHNVKCWHAGDGRSGAGNNHSIAIEICVNADGDYRQAIKNAAKLTALILTEEKIRKTEVKQHHHWSGKQCPFEIRTGYRGTSWTDFMNDVTVELNRLNVPQKNQKYVVKKGDTLYSIAKTFNTTVNQLLKDNDIKNERLIFIGDDLVINSDRDESQKGNDADQQIPTYHKVKRGDSLSAIAKQYGRTLDEIKTLNPHILPPDYIIQPNDDIKIKS